MTREHDPPHIKLYEWPNVPTRAKELADSHDIEEILGVALVPDIFNDYDLLLPVQSLNAHTFVVDEDGFTYCFIH